MPRTTLSCIFRTTVYSLTLAVLFCEIASANPALDGYSDDTAFKRRIAALTKSDLVKRTTLAETLEHRPVHALTIGTGDTKRKPAILVVGNVDAAHVAGSELALRIAEQFVTGSAKDKAIKKLLERVTVYVIPRPNPDGTAKNFQRPYHEQQGNARRTDDDRDFRLGEDPLEDLNGDGWITLMRVEDTAGKYMPHAKDPRVLIKADPKKNERGRWRLLSEGRDNDRDEAFNEDAAGGVDFNRNFTHKYPAFKQAAGPNAVSEIETRAVADFAFDHPNIVAVLSFSPHDNMFHVWQPNPAAEKAKIKTTLLSDDAPYQNLIAEKYRKLHGGKDAPKTPAEGGSFAEWAYFHYGRWSFAARGWWVPKVEAKKSPAEEKTEKDAGEEKQPDRNEKEDSKKPATKPAAKTDDRGAADVNALQWFKQQKIDGFVDWQEIKHPDFPNAKVEVGGFKPFFRLNPPVAELAELSKQHVTFLTDLGELLPRLTIKEMKIESLGAHVFRVTATISNTGFLPTVSKMGEQSRHHQRLQAEIVLPAGATIVQETTRRTLQQLAGNGGEQELVWLVRLANKRDNKVSVRAWSPAVGEVKKTVVLQ